MAPDNVTIHLEVEHSDVQCTVSLHGMATDRLSDFERLVFILGFFMYFAVGCLNQ